MDTQNLKRTKQITVAALLRPDIAGLFNKRVSTLGLKKGEYLRVLITKDLDSAGLLGGSHG